MSIASTATAHAPAAHDPLAAFLQSRKLTCNAKTQRLYTCVIGAFQTWLADRPISALTIEGYLIHVQGAAHAAAYQHDIYRMLKTCCRWLVGRGLLASDPFSGPARVPPPRRVRERRLGWTDAQLVALLHAPPPTNWKKERKTARQQWEEGGWLAREAPQARALVLVMLDTALRVGEVASLTCGQVRAPELLVRGKGGHTDRVFISAAVLAELRALAGDRPDDAYLWRGWRKGKPSTDLLRTIVYRLCERAGIAEADIPPRAVHAFRHAAAQRWARAGVPDLIIKRLMRHANLATTMIYTDGARDSEIAAVHDRADIVAGLLAQTPPTEV